MQNLITNNKPKCFKMLPCLSVTTDLSSLRTDYDVPVSSCPPVEVAAGYSRQPTADKRCILFNLVILLEGIYLKSVIRQAYKDACTGLSIAWKEKCPPTDDWLKKLYPTSFSGQVRSQVCTYMGPMLIKASHISSFVHYL